MVLDEITAAGSTSSSITALSEHDIKEVQKSIYNAIIQNDIEELTEILSNNINYDINQPLRGKKLEEEEGELESGDSKNALMIACSLDCVDIVKYFLTHTNIDVDMQDKNGETALYQASALGNVNVVKLLAKYNANLEMVNKDKVTPLIIASYNGHVSVVKALLEKGRRTGTGINVNYQDNLRKTALSFAALEGHPLIVELLLKKGADVNLADKLGWTPLMLAAYVGRANICRQLLMAKADKNLRTNDDQTASILAKEGGFHHIAEMIDKFVQSPLNTTSNYDEEFAARRSTYYGNRDSRRISTGSRLRMEMVPREKNTWWVYLSWIVTIICLDRFLIKYGKMDDARIRQAWREKVTLCFIIFMASVMVALLAFGFVSLSCSTSQPPVPLAFVEKFWGENSTGKNKVMILRGKLYNVGDYFNSGRHRPISPLDDKTLEPIINQYYGKDIAELFPVNYDAIGCNKRPATNGLFCNVQADTRYHCHTSKNSLEALESLSINRFVSISWNEITKSPTRKLFAYNERVYDLTNYLSETNTDKWLGNDNITTTWLENFIGRDVTSEISTNVKQNDILQETVKCLDHFQVGIVEGVHYGCAATTVTIVTVSSISSILAILKLLSAIIFDNFLAKRISKVDDKVDNNANKKDVIIMVPCYSEGKESMKESFDSLVATSYPDQNKLFFIVADGNITGSGNDRSTPDILLDFIIPFEENFDNVKAKSYLSIGDGTKKHNMAKVYSGYYQYQDRVVPTILVVKVGNPQERKYAKAGNRGKRDTQLVLMQLLQHAFNNDNMSPLEFDIFEKIRKLTKKTIDQYEFVVMIDADTTVKEDSIDVMVNCMNNDSSVVGLCGETTILNKTDNWVTMIQVFEYYLSHHFGKNFEAVYMNVTCLPGCFCMYRVYSYNYEGYRVPILIDENIMTNYSTNEVDTLHQKNLLLLGEDRYLTTLMLRAFPKRKTLYCPSAICETIVPNEFKVLLSQRRRWINGTVHNMFELVVSSELPGRFCCSMQFAIFLDLIGTFTAPFAAVYSFVIILNILIGSSFQLQSIFTIITFSLQLVLAVFTSYSPTIVMWFFVYFLAIPIWHFVLPLYAFWNFDDFSWGATRKLNDSGDNSSYGDTIFDRFNPNSVPFKKWDQWIKSTGGR